jgi:hypothetical protein
LCRGLATLLARGYGREEICATFALSAEQLERAAKAPPLGPEFRPLGLRPPPVDEITEAELIAELTELLHRPEASQASVPKAEPVAARPPSAIPPRAVKRPSVLHNEPRCGASSAATA